MKLLRRVVKRNPSQERLDVATRQEKRSEEILQRVERLRDEDTVISLRASRGRLRRSPGR